jgi:hypothetical protein
VNDSRLHFGLGSATEASLEIRWPIGTSETVGKVPANRLIVVKEGSGIVKADGF